MEDMLNIKNFDEFTLSQDSIFKALGIFSLVFVVGGITAVLTLSKEKRRMSWVISLINSFVLFIASSTYVFVKYPAFLLDARSAFQSVDNASALICLWLFCGNFYDLLFGLLFYRQYMDPLTAYVHHTLYMWITVTSVFGNGGFATFEPFAAGIAALLVEELPTLMLAVGSIFPSLRTDMGFGVTFFLLRVSFHAFTLVYAVRAGVSTLVVVLYCATMSMHAFWFYSWASKYGSKALKKPKKE